MYFNVNFNVFFKLIKVHFLVSELYIYQNARCNHKKIFLVTYLYEVQFLPTVSNVSVVFYPAFIFIICFAIFVFGSRQG